MKLNLFNRWEPIGTFGGKSLESQTSNTGKVFITLIRDADSGKVITKGYGPIKSASQRNAAALLKNIGPEGIHRALETGQPVMSAPKQEKPEPEWSDGAHHKAIPREVREGKEDDKPVIRNFVAKHSRMVNKAGPMKDKKNDYKRKPKHKKDSPE
jgi:hypothetical protein